MQGSVFALAAVAVTLLAGTASFPVLVLPIEGLTSKRLQDTYSDIHNGHPHEAIDIMAPRGTPVRAMVAGTIRKLFLSKPGGMTIYQFDDAQIYCFYYAHLDRYADGLGEKSRVKAGDVIGYVGSTGNADPAAPHLHLAVNRLSAGKEWWKGEPVNPYPWLVAALK